MNKTVIFDFDGTLADSLNIIIEIFQQLTGKTTDIPKEQLMKLRDLPLPALAKHMGIRWWQVPWLLYRGRKLMAARIQEVVLFEGLAEVIQKLHKQGYTLLVVSSNSAQNVRAFLQANHLEQYFAQVYGGVGVFDKASALRKVLARNRIGRMECIYVGDETRDVQACQFIGVKVIAVEWGFANPKFLASHHPNALVKTPAELLSAIQQNLN